MCFGCHAAPQGDGPWEAREGLPAPTTCPKQLLGHRSFFFFSPSLYFLFLLKVMTVVCSNLFNEFPAQGLGWISESWNGEQAPGTIGAGREHGTKRERAKCVEAHRHLSSVSVYKASARAGACV